MNELYYDLLVVGGGAAGSCAAYQAKKTYPRLRIAVAVIGTYDEGGSSNLIASEALGINAPYNLMQDGDSAAIYCDDIIKTGGGLADPKLCKILADEAVKAVDELIKLGLQFEQVDGHPEQKQLSGCTKARSLTCGGATGKAMVKVLKNQAIELGTEILENTRIVGLLKNKQGQICGAYGIQNGKELCIKAKAVILATGGAGSLFKTNVNPPTQMGDGWAMAYDAGCKFTNMEFFQIGPAVANPAIQFIIHSHMWRLKPKITNSLGEEFLQSYCENSVSADDALNLKAMSYPFSVRTDAKYVDIAIFKEIMAGRCGKYEGVYFDVTHKSADELNSLAPITYQTLLQADIDIAQAPFELNLVVQNFNGGIMIDENGFTGVEGLYAAGEITGGIHGSDRPGGNNLTDTQVFGRRAGHSAAAYAEQAIISYETDRIVIEGLDECAEEQALIAESEQIFYDNMTAVRTEQGLRAVLSFIEQHEHEALGKTLKNRFIVGRMMAEAMLARTESRGTHYREDYPDTDANWVKRIVIKKGDKGLPSLELV